MPAGMLRLARWVVLALIAALATGCLSMGELSCGPAGCARVQTFSGSGDSKPLRMSAEQMRDTNRSRLQGLGLGMTKRQALEWMGVKTFYQPEPRFLVPNPYRVESHRAQDGTTYEVVLYYTELGRRDSRVTDDEMTPLLFADGKLIGWGREFVTSTLRERGAVVSY